MISWTAVLADRLDMCKILALSWIAGSQHLFEMEASIMGVVMAGKEAGGAYEW
jgi:hypothetical protein